MEWNRLRNSFIFSTKNSFIFSNIKEYLREVTVKSKSKYAIKVLPWLEHQLKVNFRHRIWSHHGETHCHKSLYQSQTCCSNVHVSGHLWNCFRSGVKTVFKSCLEQCSTLQQQKCLSRQKTLFSHRPFKTVKWAHSPSNKL